MTVMTILIAWASLSVGIVIGAMWKSLCERQSLSNIPEANVKLHRLASELESWSRLHSRPETRKRSA
jgi:hypothetical protein